MSYRVRGILYKVGEAEQITERFRKRELVLVVDGDSRYPQHVLFQLTGNRCEALDHYSVGDEVELEFDLRGREWTGRDGEVRFFNSLEVWRLDRAGEADHRPPPPRAPAPPPRASAPSAGSAPSAPPRSPSDDAPPWDPGDRAAEDDIPF